MERTEESSETMQASWPSLIQHKAMKVDKSRNRRKFAENHVWRTHVCDLSSVMLSDPDENDHDAGNAGVRLLDVDRRRHGAENCGFHLTRSKWDPYPWVSAVDVESAADNAGVRPGDCVLEVNGEDVLGCPVKEIAEAVRSRPKQVSLLLWNAGVDPHCKPESLCCGPMPSNMQRLSTCLSAILSVMECPICLDTIPPPACQCVNGHLICSRCHAKSERCPVCRIRLSRGRSLFADQVYSSITNAFELSKGNNDKIQTAKINEIFRLRKKKNPQIKVTHSHTNKFLERFVEKSSSAENLSNQFLAPNTLVNEFNSSLRMKSLSTSEIFCPISPRVTPRAIFRDGSKSNLIFKKHCGRSFESLDGNISINQFKSASAYDTDESLYHCPFSIECDERIKGVNYTLFEGTNLLRSFPVPGDMMTQHFQEAHDGPFIQYFKCKMTFNLQNFHNDTYCILHNTGKQFFLKIDAMRESRTNSSNDFHDILIWMWVLGNQNIANEYQMQIHLYHSSYPKKLLLSLNSTIYSLHTVSWENIKTLQKGLFISNETFKALNLYSNDIILNVEIKQCTI